MKNRLKKWLFGSLTRELVMALVLSFAAGLVTALVLIIQPIGFYDPDFYRPQERIVSNIDGYVWNFNKENESYITALAWHYNVGLALADGQGIIRLKSPGVTEDKVPWKLAMKEKEVTEVGKPVQWVLVADRPMKNESFEQAFYIEMPYERAILVIWLNPVQSTLGRVFGKLPGYLLLMTPFIVFISLFVLLIRRKVRLIANIAQGVVRIAQGDFDYRLPAKGMDELSTLTEKINYMTESLGDKMLQELTSEREKREMITHVSHDLKTPLTSVLGYLKLLEGSPLQEETRKAHLARAMGSALKLQCLIEDLLLYSRLTAEESLLSLSQVNIPELLEQCIGEVALQAFAKRLILHKNFGDQDSNILADGSQLARVFENILSNAVKYSPPDSNIVISLLQEEAVILKFQNTAEHMAQEDMDHLFERFYRGEKSRNSDSGGSGLGLAIARSIVLQHGGSIEAALSGQLFTLTIRLPKEKII